MNELILKGLKERYVNLQNDKINVLKNVSFENYVDNYIDYEDLYVHNRIAYYKRNTSKIEQERRKKVYKVAISIAFNEYNEYKTLGNIEIENFIEGLNYYVDSGNKTKKMLFLHHIKQELFSTIFLLECLRNKAMQDFIHIIEDEKNEKTYTNMLNIICEDMIVINDCIKYLEYKYKALKEIMITALNVNPEKMSKIVASYREMTSNILCRDIIYKVKSDGAKLFYPHELQNKNDVLVICEADRISGLYDLMWKMRKGENDVHIKINKKNLNKTVNKLHDNYKNTSDKNLTKIFKSYNNKLIITNQELKIFISELNERLINDDWSKNYYDEQCNIVFSIIVYIWKGEKSYQKKQLPNLLLLLSNIRTNRRMYKNKGCKSDKTLDDYNSRLGIEKTFEALNNLFVC